MHTLRVVSVVGGVGQVFGMNDQPVFHRVIPAVFSIELAFIRAVDRVFAEPGLPHPRMAQRFLCMAYLWA